MYRSFLSCVFVLCSGILGSAVHTGGAHASGITLELEPTINIVTPGVVVGVDVVVGRLGNGVEPSVGAFDLDVAFDPLEFAPLGVDFGLLLGDPASLEALTDVDLSVAGIVDFAEVSLLTPAQLDALQPAEFTLARVNFESLINGVTNFALVGDQRVDDAFGNKLPIPSPAPHTLVLLGGWGLIMFRRMSCRVSALR